MCPVLWCPGASRSKAEYMMANQDGREYGMGSLIPIDLEAADEIYHFRLTCYCLATCHANDGLNLRLKFLLQNCVINPDQKQYGVYQRSVEQVYQFVTAPYTQD